MENCRVYKKKKRKRKKHEMFSKWWKKYTECFKHSSFDSLTFD